MNPAGQAGGLPKPGVWLRRLLITLLAVNVAFAVAINFAGASRGLFNLLCGSTELILKGQVWRLFTAPWMHEPEGSVTHLLFALLGLFFLGPALESSWGPRRFMRFLFFSGIIAYTTQLLLDLLLPASLSSRLVPSYWYGAFPVVEAIAVAWALSFKGQTVRLFFVLPVSATGLLLFVIAMSVLRVLWVSQTAEGLLSPFGGLLAGWLLGGGTPSPLRRAWLKLKLRRIDARAREEGARRRDRGALRVIEGGKGKDKPNGEGGRGPDGRWLN